MGINTPKRWKSLKACICFALVALFPSTMDAHTHTSLGDLNFGKIVRPTGAAQFIDVSSTGAASGTITRIGTGTVAGSDQFVDFSVPNGTFTINITGINTGDAGLTLSNFEMLYITAGIGPSLITSFPATRVFRNFSFISYGARLTSTNASTLGVNNTIAFDLEVTVS